MKLFGKKKAVDVLQTKNAELNAYIVQFDNAVSIVNNTVNSLEKISDGIKDKIQEIDDYQSELAKTREGLDNARIKNDKVIRNFKALLCVE